MKYIAEFTAETANSYFMRFYNSFNNTEENFKNGDLPRNIRNACDFQSTLRELKLFGISYDFGTYDDNGFDRIGYAKINDHVIVKNGDLNLEEMKKALHEIAGD